MIIYLKLQNQYKLCTFLYNQNPIQNQCIFGASSDNIRYQKKLDLGKIKTFFVPKIIFPSILEINPDIEKRIKLKIMAHKKEYCYIKWHIK